MRSYKQTIRSSTSLNMDLDATPSLPNTDDVIFGFSRCFKMGSNEAPGFWEMAIYSLLSAIVPLRIESDLGFELDCGIDEHGRVTRHASVVPHIPFGLTTLTWWHAPPRC